MLKQGFIDSFTDNNQLFFFFTLLQCGAAYMVVRLICGFQLHNITRLRQINRMSCDQCLTLSAVCLPPSRGFSWTSVSGPATSLSLASAFDLLPSTAESPSASVSFRRLGDSWQRVAKTHDWEPARGRSLSCVTSSLLCKTDHMGETPPLWTPPLFV